MCLAIPGKVKKIQGLKALVEYPNETREAFISDDEVKVGDFVMVQMGIIVKKISKEESKKSIKAWKNI